MKSKPLQRLTLGLVIASLIFLPNYSFAFKAPAMDGNSDILSQPAALVKGGKGKSVNAGLGLVTLRERGLKQTVTGDQTQAAAEFAKGLINSKLERESQTTGKGLKADLQFSSEVKEAKTLVDSKGNKHIRLIQKYRNEPYRNDHCKSNLVRF